MREQSRIPTHQLILPPPVTHVADPLAAVDEDSTSLSWLAEKFIEYLERAPHGTADISAIADSLRVPRRRLYDITNVLEGVGLLDKRGKNTVVWR